MSDDKLKRNWALRKDQICEDRKKIYISQEDRKSIDELIDKKPKVNPNYQKAF